MTPETKDGSENPPEEIRILSESTLRDISKPEAQSVGGFDFALDVCVGTQWTRIHDDRGSMAKPNL